MHLERMDYSPIGLKRAGYFTYFRSMILVTGGTGLVGSHVLRALWERGERKIRATYRSESSLSIPKRVFEYAHSSSEEFMDAIDWVQVDLTDPVSIDEAMDGVETVFHCAAMVSFLPKDKYALLEGNPSITRHLVNAALHHKVSAFLHVSSVAALGRTKSGELIDEGTEWKDSPLNSVYAQSKYAAELEVWRGMEEGLNVGLVHPTIILGPADWKSGSSKFFHTFYKGFPYYTEGVTGFVDVEDVVRVLLAVWDKKAFGRKFIAVGENLSYRTLFRWITQAYGKPEPHKKPSSWMFNVLWRLEWIRSWLTGAQPLVTRETTRSAQSEHFYSNARAKEELGVEFTPIEASVKRYAALYQKDLEKGVIE